MISVIIPTYNRAKYIERAIDSVLNQTYKDFEIIVVDDNNPKTDERLFLEEKMKKYFSNSKVKYIQHNENLNGAVARNTGIKVAKGDYITFLDDDDYYLPKRLEKLANILEKNFEYDAIYSSIAIVKNNHIIKTKIAKKNGNLQIDILKQNSFFSTGSNMFFRKRVFEELKEFDTSFLRHQDLEFFVRFFNKFKIINLNDVLVVKDLDDRSNTPNIKNALKYRIQYLDKFEKEINNYSDLVIKSIYEENLYDLILMAKNNNDKEMNKIIRTTFRSKYNISLGFKMNIKLYLSYINKKYGIQDLINSLKINRYKENESIILERNGLN